MLRRQHSPLRKLFKFSEEGPETGSEAGLALFIFPGEDFFKSTVDSQVQRISMILLL